MTTKTETAAEQYARLKREQFEAFLEASFTDEALKDVQLYEVKAASGMVFKCRKPDGPFLTQIGSMPMALSENLITKQDGGQLTNAEKAARFDALSDVEKRANIQATARLVRYVAVSPRIIVGDVGIRTDAISSDMLTMADFSSLAEWSNGEGGEAVALKTFRTPRKRRRA